MCVSGSSRGSDAELKQHTITLGEKQEGDGAAVAFVSPDWTNRLPAMEKNSTTYRMKLDLPRGLNPGVIDLIR